jgi:alpha-L-fucosidase 2
MPESIGVAAIVTEFLMQSVVDTIRVFPCWPKEQDAKFTRLRAQGGFLVSAEQKDGQVTKLEITSTVGGTLRLLNPWTDKIVEHAMRPGQKLAFTGRE